jgi:hypothetical protein
MEHTPDVGSPVVYYGNPLHNRMINFFIQKRWNIQKSFELGWINVGLRLNWP